MYLLLQIVFRFILSEAGKMEDYITNPRLLIGSFSVDVTADWTGISWFFFPLQLFVVDSRKAGNNKSLSRGRN